VLRDDGWGNGTGSPFVRSHTDAVALADLELHGGAACPAGPGLGPSTLQRRTWGRRDARPSGVWRPPGEGFICFRRRSGAGSSAIAVGAVTLLPSVGRVVVSLMEIDARRRRTGRRVMKWRRFRSRSIYWI